MKLAFGRVVPAPDGDDRTTEPRGRRPALGRFPYGRVASKLEVDAAERARTLVARAETKAGEIVEQARREAAQERLAALVEARAEAASRVAAHALALAERDDRALERDLDRIVDVARVLAERVLGEALALEPGRVLALARRALEEARGARRVTIVAHPDDARLIEEALSTLEAAGAATVLSDPARGRGNLRLETDVGVLDADLAPQLDRLLPKLRESLRNG